MNNNYCIEQYTAKDGDVRVRLFHTMIEITTGTAVDARVHFLHYPILSTLNDVVRADYPLLPQMHETLALHTVCQRLMG